MSNAYKDGRAYQKFLGVEDLEELLVFVDLLQSPPQDRVQYAGRCVGLCLCLDLPVISKIRQLGHRPPFEVGHIGEGLNTLIGQSRVVVWIVEQHTTILDIVEMSRCVEMRA